MLKTLLALVALAVPALSQTGPTSFEVEFGDPVPKAAFPIEAVRVSIQAGTKFETVLDFDGPVLGEPYAVTWDNDYFMAVQVPTKRGPVVVAQADITYEGGASGTSWGPSNDDGIDLGYTYPTSGTPVEFTEPSLLQAFVGRGVVDLEWLTAKGINMTSDPEGAMVASNDWTGAKVRFTYVPVGFAAQLEESLPTSRLEDSLSPVTQVVHVISPSAAPFFVGYLPQYDGDREPQLEPQVLGPLAGRWYRRLRYRHGVLQRPGYRGDLHA